jgi:hypothetical protein
MANKENNEANLNPVTEEFKENSVKYVLGKFEYDLYHEEDNKSEKVIRVKRFSLPNNGERWKIFENNKEKLIVEGSSLTKKEKEFLRTPVGFNFLITKYKEGIKSFNALKNEIKNNLK